MALNIENFLEALRHSTVRQFSRTTRDVPTPRGESQYFLQETLMEKLWNRKS